MNEVERLANTKSVYDAMLAYRTAHLARQDNVATLYREAIGAVLAAALARPADAPAGGLVERALLDMIEMAEGVEGYNKRERKSNAERIAAARHALVAGRYTDSHDPFDCGLCLQRRAAQPAPAPTDQAGERVREAARAVVWFDWSDNDPDAVAAIERLRAALTRAPSGTADVFPTEADAER